MIRKFFAVFMFCLFSEPVLAEPDIFNRVNQSLWGFVLREGMRCHENPHSIHFNSDRSKAFFKWDSPMISYENKVDQDAVYDVIEHTADSITMYLHEESRTTENGSPVIWILRFSNSETYCWGRTDWDVDQCTHVHVRCDMPANIS